MMQYYAINLTQTNVKKSSTGGATLYGGGQLSTGGATLRGGGNDFALRGGQGGLREILNFENRFFKCQFF